MQDNFYIVLVVYLHVTASSTPDFNLQEIFVSSVQGLLFS
jgi:hypothetical protein